jgi:hypothetical protein
MLLLGPTATAQSPAVQSQSSQAGGMKQLLSSFEKRAHSGSASLGSVVRHPELYTTAQFDSLIGGLERLALVSESALVRGEAARNIAAAGSAEYSEPRIIHRLIALYEKSDDELVKRSILARMYQQKDRRAAIVFLKGVASKSIEKQDYPDASFEAASNLTHMGDEGVNALAELRRTGQLRDPEARGFVEWFFRKG